MSTCCPSPLLDRSASASMAPTAASPAAWRKACGTAVRTGARSSSPVMASWQPAAWTVRSVAGQSAFGPVPPNGEIDTVTSAGLAARSVSRSTGTAPHSNSTSASAAQFGQRGAGPRPCPGPTPRCACPGSNPRTSASAPGPRCRRRTDRAGVPRSIRWLDEHHVRAEPGRGRTRRGSPARRRDRQPDTSRACAAPPCSPAGTSQRRRRRAVWPWRRRVGADDRAPAGGDRSVRTDSGRVRRGAQRRWSSSSSGTSDPMTPQRWPHYVARPSPIISSTPRHAPSPTSPRCGPRRWSISPTSRTPRSAVARRTCARPQRRCVRPRRRSPISPRPDRTASATRCWPRCAPRPRVPVQRWSPPGSSAPATRPTSCSPARRTQPPLATRPKPERAERSPAATHDTPAGDRRVSTPERPTHDRRPTAAAGDDAARHAHRGAGATAAAERVARATDAAAAATAEAADAAAAEDAARRVLEAARARLRSARAAAKRADAALAAARRAAR